MGKVLRGVVCAFVAAGVFCALAEYAPAVVTFDLLHDNPETRGVLKEELGMASLPAGERPEEIVTSHDDLETLWFAREKFLQIGEQEKARIQLSLLWERQMERGVRNLPSYGEVLAREARRDLGSGKLLQAQEVLAVARKLSPESLPVYFASASLVLERGFWNLLGAGRELAKGARAVERSFRLQSWALTNLFFTLSIGALFFFAIFTLSALLKFAGRIVHDMGESLPRALSARARMIIGWIIFFLPLLVGLPAWWWFVLAGVALWPYVGRFPRVVLLLAAAFLFSLPWQIEFASSLLSIHRQTLLQKVVTIREDNWAATDYQAIKKAAAEEGANPLARFATGLAAKRLGLFDEAREAYESALESSPRDAAVWNNIGNLALINKEVDESISHYRSAIEIDPGLFAPHYNLSLAYREKFLFPEGESESRQAARIDPAANAYYTSISGQHFNRYTVDELPSLEDIWRLALRKNKWQRATADHLWMSAMFLAPRQIWPFTLGGAILLGLIFWVLRASRGIAEACSKCGRVYCPRCRGSAASGLCGQCHQVFVRKQGVEAKVRVGKMASIQRRQKQKLAARIALSALVPGSGHLYSGRYVTGTFYAFPACAALAWFYVTRGAYPSTWHLQLSGGPALLVVGGVLYLLWWAMSLWSSLWIEE
ncbi:tetratricopeptide repeat protein [Candidatus Moduliflexota bacterium]